MIPIPALLEVGGKILDRVLPNEQAKAEAMAKLKEIERSEEHTSELQSH